MKNTILLSFGAAVAVGAALFFNSASKGTADVQVIDYFEGDPVGVFELAADDVNKNSPKFKQVAAKAGLSFADAEARTSAGAISFVDEKGGDATRQFEYNAAKGYLSFNKGMTKQILRTDSKLPAEKEASAIAEKFLADNQLLPANKSDLKLEHVGGIKRVSSKDKKEYDVMKTVHYSRTLNGIPVVGEGSKMIIDIGDKGEVFGVTRRWKEVKGGANQKVAAAADMKTAAEAEGEFRKIVASQFGDKATSRVNTVSKLYYQGDGNYIQPVYLMAATVKVQTAEGKTIERDYIQPIAMLKKAPEAIQGSLDDLMKAKGESGIKSADPKQTTPPDSGAPKRKQ